MRNGSNAERVSAVGEVGRRADLPAFGKQAHRSTGQTEAARPALQPVEHVLQAVGGGQIGLQVQQPGEQPFVGAGLFHQQRDLFFQPFDVIALAGQMPFHQRNGAAHRVRHAHLLNLACVANKEIRVLQQILHHGVVIQRRPATLCSSTLFIDE